MRRRGKLAGHLTQGRRSRGIALVAVLWVVSLLAASFAVTYRAEKALGGEAPPFRYVVAIKSKPSEEVDAEMSNPEWEGFVADFESRTRDAVYVSATRIIG